MTVSTTVGTELNIDTILTTGLTLSGVLAAGQTARDGDLALGRILLDTYLDSLLTMGVYAKSVEFVEVTMVPGQAFYTLPTSVLDLVAEGAYIDPTQVVAAADGETVVIPMDREEWQRLSSKNADGRPTKYYLYRANTPLQVRLWPTPDEAGTVRFQAQMLMADTYEGTKTVDLRQYWTQHLVWEMAHQFAVSKSLDSKRLSMLNKRSQEKLEYCRNFANQHIKTVSRYATPNRWNNR